MLFRSLKQLFGFRKSSLALQEGSFLHYVPERDVYVYFRRKDRETVMVILNNQSGEQNLDLSRFRETLGSSTEAIDAVTGKTVQLKEHLMLAPRSALILEIRP